MGVRILGPAHVWGDNKGVVNSAFISETRITKKYLGIFYHAVRKASAQGIWLYLVVVILTNVSISTLT